MIWNNYSLSCYQISDEMLSDISSVYLSSQVKRHQTVITKRLSFSPEFVLSRALWLELESDIWGSLVGALCSSTPLCCSLSHYLLQFPEQIWILDWNTTVHSRLFSKSLHTARLLYSGEKCQRFGQIFCFRLRDKRSDVLLWTQRHITPVLNTTSYSSHCMMSHFRTPLS
jgi:hypothetical protein